jgi:hypothetical protein
MLIVLAGLAACASGPEKASERVVDAATAPLGDLNVVQAHVPPVLLAARQQPYRAPSAPGCTALADEIKALDAALGADLDQPADDKHPGLIERGGNLAGDAAVGALKSTAENVIPFRGWVRKLSGAERYARDVAAAITAGTVRRAYLKGLGQAAACPAPAAPQTAAVAAR